MSRSAAAPRGVSSSPKSRRDGSRPRKPASPANPAAQGQGHWPDRKGMGRGEPGGERRPSGQSRRRVRVGTRRSPRGRVPRRNVRPVPLPQGVRPTREPRPKGKRRPGVRLSAGPALHSGQRRSACCPLCLRLRAFCWNACPKPCAGSVRSVRPTGVLCPTMWPPCPSCSPRSGPGCSAPYWSSPAAVSAYLYYFLPWNLLRLTRLLAALPLSDPRAAAPAGGRPCCWTWGPGR